MLVLMLVALNGLVITLGILLVLMLVLVIMMLMLVLVLFFLLLILLIWGVVLSYIFVGYASTSATFPATFVSHMSIVRGSSSV